MAKSRSFSVYLLKEGYQADNALKADHGLLDHVAAKELSADARVLVLDGKPHTPWWREYFGIEKDLKQMSKGALIFLKVGKRCFALAHGHVAHNLKDESYEYDFGLRVTLNCVDPKELKSTDSLDPGMGRRQRTQLPVGSDLTLFEFDRDSSILRRLTGKVKEKHKKLLKHATGASNLRVSSDVPAAKLEGLCGELLKLYEDTEYKKTFPDIQNIMPVADPLVIQELDKKLVAALRNRADSVNLTVPEIVSYDDNVYARFSGAGAGLRYDDVYIDAYYEYLLSRNKKLAEITVEDVKHHSLVLANEDGSPRDSFSIYKSLVFDTKLDGKAAAAYHLCEGNWYKVDHNYAQKLKQFLDPHCKDTALIPFDHANEGEYNIAAAKAANMVCLDKTNISPAGQTAVEPCDLYSVEGGKGVFYSVKISTLSAALSHQFNQGTNAVELIRVEPEALNNLKLLIQDAVPKPKFADLVQPLDNNMHQVVFAIITHKDKAGKSENLPLFSRISLMRNLKALRGMGITGCFSFVEDKSPYSAGTKIKRKAKKAKK